MQDNHYVGTLFLGWKRILSFAVVSALFGIALSFLFPLQYSSTMRLLIIQRQLSAADPYTAIKASERISDNLTQAIYTATFFDKVLVNDSDAAVRLNRLRLLSQMRDAAGRVADFSLITG